MAGQFEDQGYECVEPDLGRDLPLLDDPDLSPSYKRKLLAHLSVCDDCRLRRDLLVQVSARMKSGELEVHSQNPRRFQSGLNRMIAWGGGISLAAGLGLLMLLPPQARDSELFFRSEGQDILIRPVEGEVVAGGRPSFQWNQVDGATGYRLVVREVGGEGAWRGETSATNWSIPQGEDLPQGVDFRASLQTIPADLTPQPGFNVSFRTGSRADQFLQRIRRGNNGARLISVLGALVSLLAVGRGLLGRSG